MDAHRHGRCPDAECTDPRSRSVSNGHIPVDEAPNYRVVVPVEGDAVWTDVS